MIIEKHPDIGDEHTTTELMLCTLPCSKILCACSNIQMQVIIEIYAKYNRISQTIAGDWKGCIKVPYRRGNSRGRYCQRSQTQTSHPTLEQINAIGQAMNSVSDNRHKPLRKRDVQQCTRARHNHQRLPVQAHIKVTQTLSPRKPNYRTSQRPLKMYIS